MDPKLDGALEFYNKDLDRHGLSYRVPNIYDTQALNSFREHILASTTTRGEICREFIRRDDWDIFLTVFSEIHMGGHMLWHLSQDHPLSEMSQAFDSDPLLEIYQAVDREIGLIAELVGVGNDLVVYSIDSMESDCLETARSLFLPEFLYRWNFPGKAALAKGDAGTRVPEVCFDYPLHWKDEIWKLRTDDGGRELQSPQEQSENKDTFHWQPTNWYKPVWDRMKAFALPSVADGYIRINVKGREARGIVEPADYQRSCSEIIQCLSELVDARTGRPVVERIIQVRSDPFEDNLRQPPADLIVLWQEESPTDVVDSPLVGRIGPVPYFRPGGHQKQGSKIENFFMIRAADCAPGTYFAEGSLEDLPATILSRMGIEIPKHFDGRPLQKISRTECA
jgi:predicted AlkP superfamily phosphohydrolase/phosphomutase